VVQCIYGSIGCAGNPVFWHFLCGNLAKNMNKIKKERSWDNFWYVAYLSNSLESALKITVCNKDSLEFHFCFLSMSLFVLFCCFVLTSPTPWLRVLHNLAWHQQDYKRQHQHVFSVLFTRTKNWPAKQVEQTTFNNVEQSRSTACTSSLNCKRNTFLSERTIQVPLN